MIENLSKLLDVNNTSTFVVGARGLLLAGYVCLVAFLFGASVDQILAALQPTGFIGLVVISIQTLWRQRQEEQKNKEERERAQTVERRDLILRVYNEMKPDLENLTAEIAVATGGLKDVSQRRYAEQFRDGRRTAYVPLLTANGGKRLSVILLAPFRNAELLACKETTAKKRDAVLRRMKADRLRSQRLNRRFERYNEMFVRLQKFVDGDLEMWALIQCLPLGCVHSAINNALALQKSKTPLESSLLEAEQ